MRRKITPFVLAPWLLLLLCVCWGLWPALTIMADRWAWDPRYSHGCLVPLFSLGLLWSRRDTLAEARPRPSGWGLALIALGAAVQVLGGYFHLNAIDGAALITYLAGIVLLLAGRRFMTYALPAIAFLVFMIPLPWRIEVAMGQPLQRIATFCSVYGLQTLGFAAFSEGFVIQLNEARIGVVDACSGLSMLMTFLALSTAAAMVVRRPLLDKVVLVLSSIPVALIANVGRIMLTGVLFEMSGKQTADRFYHDLAGWLMIPFALSLYWLEIRLLSCILIEKAAPIPLRVGLGTVKGSKNERVAGLVGE